MKGKTDTGLGIIVINPDVIATYAGSVAVESFGVVGMAAVNMKDGLIKLLRRDSIKHGIHVQINDDTITIDFHVIVLYGVNIPAVAENIIGSVRRRVEEFTGMKVECVNVIVEGVRVID